MRLTRDRRLVEVCLYTEMDPCKSGFLLQHTCSLSFRPQKRVVARTSLDDFQSVPESHIRIVDVREYGDGPVSFYATSLPCSCHRLAVLAH